MHACIHTYIHIHTTQVSFSPSRLSTTSDSEVYITANVQFSACEGASRSAINFVWTQLATSDGEMAPINFNIASVTSSTMYIPKYALTAGKSYRLLLTLSLSEDPGRVTQVTYDFSVGAVPLIANIQGGDSIKIGSESDLVLDGSLSSDPNIDPALDQGLTYTWSCILVDESFSQACLDKNGNPLVLPANRVVTIVKGTLLPSLSADVPYRFILRVSKQARCDKYAYIYTCAYLSYLS
jgi:hypothetical protein